jgi:hypothetical protein
MFHLLVMPGPEVCSYGGCRSVSRMQLALPDEGDRRMEEIDRMSDADQDMPRGPTVTATERIDARRRQLVPPALGCGPQWHSA